MKETFNDPNPNANHKPLVPQPRPADRKEFDASAPPEERYRALVHNTKDWQHRLGIAAELHPEMADHFNKLIQIANVSLYGFSQYYSEQYGIKTGTILPYAGTEGAESMPELPRIPNIARQELPA